VRLNVTRQVSKAWQSLVFDGQLWDALDLASSPPHLSPALLLRLAAHAGSFVRSLSLRGWTHLDPVTLRVLVHSLTVLPAESDDMLGPSSVIESPFPPTNLTHLSLRTCTSLTTACLHHVLLRAPSLRSVDLHGLGAVINATCGVMSAFCPGIESLDLGRCPNMDADGLLYLFGLYLFGDGAAWLISWIGDEGSFPSPAVVMRQSDRPTSRLRVLKASGLGRLNEDVLTVLGNAAPHLEVLDLSGARHLTDKAVEAFVTWDDAWDLPSCTSYQCKIELSAREMGRDPATEFGPCVKRMTRLRHLNLSSCILLTDLACTHLAHCVSQLEFLELGGIGPGLKDEGLVRLLSTTPLLRRLDLEDASDITDAVLEVLTVSPPGDVIRRGGRARPLPPPGRNLEHLILSYALSVTNDALLGLIRTCRRLTVLECDNTRISGMVLREFVKLSRQRKLRGAEVVAVDCRAITESLVKELASSGRTRARKGYRHYEARLLGYVDAKDVEDLGASGVLGGMDVDDCDDTRVAIKSFWSWQAVDAIRQAREKRRKLALNARRNTDAGVLEGFRRSGLSFDDDEELLSGNSGAGPSSRPRWLTHWGRLPGSGSSSPTGTPFANEDDRGCIII
jgi:F-box and leucine-rich repeat protein 2/20